MLRQSRQRQASGRRRRRVDRAACVEEGVRQARALDIAVIAADAEAAQRSRQEITCLLVGEFEPLDLSMPVVIGRPARSERSEEHTSELKSHRSISYAVFCLKKKQILR